MAGSSLRSCLPPHVVAALWRFLFRSALFAVAPEGWPASTSEEEEDPQAAAPSGAGPQFPGSFAAHDLQDPAELIAHHYFVLNCGPTPLFLGQPG